MKPVNHIVATLVIYAVAFGTSGCGGGGAGGGAGGGGAGGGGAGMPALNDAAAMRSLTSSSAPVHNFRFMAVARDATSGDNIVMGADGRFGPKQAFGSGSYTRWHPTTTVPAPVISAGTLHVTKFVSFTSPGTFGAIEAGILVVKVNLLQSVPNRAVISATLTVYCNIPPAGLLVGHPEGIKLQETAVTFDTLEGMMAATGFSAGPE